tara:strand:- start:1300 stop:1746 length:447 start_codon:yes stop_codon:yes gene_type:complete
MGEWLADYYLWIKALHVISVIFWMAGMAYLPRLYVYHSMAEVGSAQSETFKVMEQRLLRGIINPAMIATLIFGVAMIWANPDLMKQGWFHAKLGFVFLMFGAHGAYSKYRKDFAADRNTRSTRFYRIVNEVPPVLVVLIVILVIVKPF